MGVTARFTGLRTGPPHGVRESQSRSGCVTRVQEIARGGKLQGGRFHSWNRGERRCLPHRSKQSDSVAPSTSTGQSQLWRLHFVNRGVQGGTDVSRSREAGAVSRSVCVLALRRRLRRSPGPERQTPQVSAGDHSGQDAKPAPHRLLLLGGVRRRPAIVRWSPRQLFPSLRFAATHRIAALARECAQSQRGIRPPIALRTDAGRYRLSFFRPLPRSTGGVQEFEFGNRMARGVSS